MVKKSPVKKSPVKKSPVKKSPVKTFCQKVGTVRTNPNGSKSTWVAMKKKDGTMYAAHRFVSGPTSGPGSKGYKKPSKK